jgi:site-specific DNA-methyltransferase (adenine-specific)
VKAARGKTPTDVWWHTIVSPTGKEKTGYATQKPLGMLERIVRVHSKPGDMLLDFFAGSGTFGAAAKKNKRHFLMIDENPEAIRVMEKRLGITSESPAEQREDHAKLKKARARPPRARPAGQSSL